MIENTKFYYLEEPNNRRIFRADFTLKFDRRDVTRGAPVPEPLEMRWTMGGRTATDIVYTTAVDPIIVSDRVVEVLRAGGFTGWGLYPIRLYGKDGNHLPGYHGLSFLGRCAPLDWSHAEEINMSVPAGYVPCQRGPRFERDEWDGSDLFMCTNQTGHKFVTDRVKRAFESARFKYMAFTPLGQLYRRVPGAKLIPFVGQP